MATDDFNRADGSVGSNYSAAFGAINTITSNAVVGASSAENASVRTAESYGAAQSAQITLSTDTASRGFALLLRGTAGSYTGYMCFGGFANSWSISEYLNGTQVGADLNSGSLGTNWAVSQTAKAEMDSGSNITFYRNGVSIGTASDATVTSGKPGIYTYSDQGIDDLVTTGDSSGISITSGLGQAVLAGLAPSLAATANWFVSAGLGQAVITGLAPGVAATGGVSISAGLGQLALGGLAPTLAATANEFAAPGLGQLVLGGLAPGVAATSNASVASGLGQLTFTGYAPAQTLTLPSPSPASLVLAGYAPSLQITAHGAVTTGLGALVLTGFVPTLSATGNLAIAPSLGTLTLAALAPSLSLTANVAISPGLAQAVLTGLAPSLAATANQFAAPSFATLAVSGLAPSLTQAGAFSITPDAGILLVSGFSPTVRGSEETLSGGFVDYGTLRERRRGKKDEEAHARVVEGMRADMPASPPASKRRITKSDLIGRVSAKADAKSIDELIKKKRRRKEEEVLLLL